MLILKAYCDNFYFLCYSLLFSLFNIKMFVSFTLSIYSGVVCRSLWEYIQILEFNLTIKETDIFVIRNSQFSLILFAIEQNNLFHYSLCTSAINITKFFSVFFSFFLVLLSVANDQDKTNWNVSQDKHPVGGSRD